MRPPKALTGRHGQPHAWAMTVLPFPTHSTWVSDARGDGRAVRVSAHTRVGLVVVSVWNGDTCGATLRLKPEEVVELVTALTRGLADLRAPDASLRTVAE